MKKTKLLKTGRTREFHHVQNKVLVVRVVVSLMTMCKLHFSVFFSLGSYSCLLLSFSSSCDYSIDLNAKIVKDDVEDGEGKVKLSWEQE